MKRLLVIDDEPQMRMAMKEVLKRKGYEVMTASNGRDGIKIALSENPDAIITDIKMDDMDGIGVLRSVKKRFPLMPVLMVTAFGTIENAIEAMKLGASDYILKPFSPEMIHTAVKKMIPAEERRDFGIAGESREIMEALRLASRVAPTSATVLITGESGTGKELLARYIHSLSDRKDMPFVAVNCASIPDGLLESELFGHERGAFTGAHAKKRGKFELAHRGTILLDEIGDMGIQLQSKLLRVLQEREIDIVGGNAPVPVDIRVIATTNRLLKKEVEANNFREDLFYRLNVFPIVIPPLRERVGDIDVMSQHFLKDFCRKHSKNIAFIGDDAMSWLRKRRWSGNIREMKNVIERAVLMCDDERISLEDLSFNENCDDIAESSFVLSGITMREMEKRMIGKVLDENEGNRTRTARKLGISVRTLRNKLREYGQGCRP